MWTQAVTGFRELWEFPNCLGSTDGKHVKLQCPASSGSNYFCYKNDCSIVLLAIVDPFYKFIIADIGSYRWHIDSGIFKNSAFYREYSDGKTILPLKLLPGRNIPVPHVLIDDEDFALQMYLMRPFPRAAIANDARKKKFNKQLSRARRVVENAFGILAQKWRVFFRPIETDAETAERVVKAACCLHNYILRNNIQIAATETEELVEPVRAFSDTSLTNLRSNNAAFVVKVKQSHKRPSGLWGSGRLRLQNF
jgi:hypothetical protein